MSENIYIWLATQIRIFTHIGDTWCVPGVYIYFLCIFVVSFPLKLSNYLTDMLTRQLFHDGALNFIETSPLICKQGTDQLCKKESLSENVY